MTRSDILKSSIVVGLQRARSWLFGIGFWRFYLLLLGIAILQNGIWYSPLAAQYLMMSRSIIKNPFLAQTSMEWVLTSFLGPALAYLIGMNRSITSYSLMQLGLFLVGFSALLIVIRRRHGDFIARCVMLAFFLSPLPHVLFTWLGTPDVLTVLLAMTLVIFWTSPVSVVICSLLMGINHPEQALLLLFLLSVSLLLTRPWRESARFAVLGLGAALLGGFLLQWYFNSRNFDVVFTRTDYILARGLGPFVQSALHEPFALIFSLFNCLLLFLIVYFWYFGWKSRFAVAFGIYSALAFLSLLITFDQTRVFAVVTFPAILLLILSPAFENLECTEQEFFGMVLTISFLAGIFIPRFVVWNGSVSSSAYGQIIAYFIDHGARSLP